MNYSKYENDFSLITFKGNLEDLDAYYGEDYMNQSPKFYNVSNVFSSQAGMAIKDISNHRTMTKNDVLTLRNQSVIRCKYRNTVNYPNCSSFPCVFDIFDDPCDNRNLSIENPEVSNT